MASGLLCTRGWLRQTAAALAGSAEENASGKGGKQEISRAGHAVQRASGMHVKKTRLQTHVPT
jgi:hypothetical protein